MRKLLLSNLSEELLSIGKNKIVKWKPTQSQTALNVPRNVLAQFMHIHMHMYIHT